MENGFLRSLQMDRRTPWGVGGGGGFHVWLTRNVCSAWDLWDPKKYSISLFSVLNWVAIIFECILPLNRVRVSAAQSRVSAAQSNFL